jgi:DNA polymerase III delta prime subunit
MGQCVSNKNSKVKPDIQSEAIASKLEAVRGKFMTSIHQLHIISLDCSDGMEKCIIQDDRSLAIILRLKYMFLRNKLSVLQELIKKIDEIEPNDKLRKKKLIVSEAESVLETLKLMLAQKDVDKILSKEPEYNDQVSKEIKKCNLNEIEAENFVDNEIKERNSSPSRRNRRRYSRRLTSL